MGKGESRGSEVEDFGQPIGGCESWTIKKVERQRTDAFELWRWRGT